jgi:hypothetical protein
MNIPEATTPPVSPRFPVREGPTDDGSYIIAAGLMALPPRIKAAEEVSPSISGMEYARKTIVRV